MTNFVQSMEYDVHMYAEIQELIIYRFFINKYIKFWSLKILYKVILYKNGVGQAHCVDLLERVNRILLCIFRSFNLVSMIFYKLKWISGII
jgi:hypothetical protein